MAVTTYYSLAGQLIGEQTMGGPQIDYIPDALGSVVAAVDENLNTVYTASYTPFGQTIASTGTAPRVTWCGTLGYLSSAGQTHCEHHVSTRFYSDSAGSWTSVDKLWPRQPAYGYVRGNPTTLADPSGMAGSSVGTGGHPKGPSRQVGDFIKIYTSDPKAKPTPRFTAVAGSIALPNQIALMPGAYAAFYLGAADVLEGGLSVQRLANGSCAWKAFLHHLGEKGADDELLTGVTCGSVIRLTLAFSSRYDFLGIRLPLLVSQLWIQNAPFPLYRMPVGPTSAKTVISTEWPYGASAVKTSHSRAQWKHPMHLVREGLSVPQPWNAAAPNTTRPISGQLWLKPGQASPTTVYVNDYSQIADRPLGASLRPPAPTCACTPKSSQGTGTGIPT